MIVINFASIDFRRLSRVYSGLAVMLVLLFAATATMVWMDMGCSRDISSMNERLNALAAAHEQMKPLLLERERLEKDMSVMSGLMESRSFSWTRLLTDIETVFPVGVALSRLEFNPRDRTLVFDGKAQSPESLRNFMIGMEKSRSFRDPLLKHQSVEQGSNTFNVVAFYSGDKIPGVAVGK